MPGTIEWNEQGLFWRESKETVWVRPWGRDGARVQATQSASFAELPNALTVEPPQAQPSISQDGELVILENGCLRVELNVDGRLRFFNTQSGLLLLEEPVRHFARPPARRWRPNPGGAHRLQLHFNAQEGERLYGLGQHSHGRLNNKGCVIELEQRNGHVCIPWMISSRGYGFLWNHPGLGSVELAHNGTRWTAESARQMDYYVAAGESPADLMARYAEVTGHSPVLPEWAAGFWQSKLRYASQEELLSVAREYKARGLPLDVIVIDFFHWTMMGEWKFEPTAWPDPAGMVRALAEMGVKVMVSVWPTVNHYSEHFTTMRDRGYLVLSEQGQQVHNLMYDIVPGRPAPLAYYDPTHPEARAFLWEQIKKNYYKNGIKLFWLDADEPELLTFDHALLRYHLGHALEVGCAYPLFHQQAFYDGLLAAGETEILTLSRSAWAGSQRYGTIVWSGDIASRFDVLRDQVKAGLNMALSGIPWWTTDIGGFYGGDVDSPSFRELIVRWFQFGVFCPIFRLHGHRTTSANADLASSGAGNEVWSFGERAYTILSHLLGLRERLKPYILRQMHAAHQEGAPPMRPLFYDFPGDPAAWDVEDQFMLGPDLLLAPVLHESARSRLVYLPGGAAWVDAWDGHEYPGGQWLEMDAPLEKVPAFWRAGSAWAIPFQPAYDNRTKRFRRPVRGPV